MIPNTVHYVIYNGIELNLTKIENFDSEVVYSQDGTDRLYNHITITVRGIVNQQVNVFGYANAQFLKACRLALMEPRRPLAVYINGVATITSDGKDAKNGPAPKNVRVYQFQGATVMAEFTIEYWETVCESSSLIVLSNRWKQKTEIDVDGYTTVSSTGRIIINTALGNNADVYRAIPYPVNYLYKGFTRTNQSFEVSEDGSTLDWSITDREMYLPPPVLTATGGAKQNITQWNGTWREESSLEMGGGAVIQGTLTVKAWGQKNVSKNMLLLFCVKVLDSRLKQGDIIKFYAIEEGLDENTVSMVVTVITFSSKDLQQTKIQVTTRIGLPVKIYENGDQTATAISSRGNVGAWIVVKDIVASCDDKTTLDVYVSNNQNHKPVLIGSEPPEIQNDLSEDTNNVKQTEGSPYVLSHIETQVVEKENIIQLPRATTGSDGNCFYARPNQPLSKKIVRFQMERLNAQPQLPQLTISSNTMLEKVITMSDPMILPSGVDRIYSVKGQYIFAYDATAQIGYNDITMPAAITDSVGIGPQNQIGSSTFVTGLIAPA